MHLCVCFFLFYASLSQTYGKTIEMEVKCPSYCKCDMFETLRRATCTNIYLAHMELNLAPKTQYLDLSNNQIITLTAEVFLEQKLESLKLLNLSHNKISQIDLNAFQGLSELKSLDMSYNGIQYLRQNWFWPLVSLEELYLRGNSFTTIKEGPFLTSKTLKRLDLSHCHISYIGKNVLTELPNLAILEVSHNYLNHLYVDTIRTLPNLQILNANNNSLICDPSTSQLSNYTVQKGIRFKNPCAIKTVETEKFQRILNAPQEEEPKNSWIYDDRETVFDDNETTTKSDVNCNITDSKSLLQEIVDLSPSLSIILPFIYGVAVGVLISSIYQLVLQKNRRLSGRNTYYNFDDGCSHLQRPIGRTRSTRSLRRLQSSEERQTLPLKEWGISESTPVLYRKNQSKL